MTELTRLFDMIRNADSTLLVERECDCEERWIWVGRVTTWADGWRTFTAKQPSPEACVADLVLQLADWFSREAVAT